MQLISSVHQLLPLPLWTVTTAMIGFLQTTKLHRIHLVHPHGLVEVVSRLPSRRSYTHCLKLSKKIRSCRRLFHGIRPGVPLSYMIPHDLSMRSFRSIFVRPSSHHFRDNWMPTISAGREDTNTLLVTNNLFGTSQSYVNKSNEHLLHVLPVPLGLGTS